MPGSGERVPGSGERGAGQDAATRHANVHDTRAAWRGIRESWTLGGTAPYDSGDAGASESGAEAVTDLRGRQRAGRPKMPRWLGSSTSRP